MEARKTNDSMGGYIVHQIVNKLCTLGIKVKDSRILLLGFTFKENCPDIRNTKVIDLYHSLESFTHNITIYDPHANAETVQEEYGISLITDMNKLPKNNDVAVLCVAHNEMLSIDINQYIKPEGIIYDVKGILPLSPKTYRL